MKRDRAAYMREYRARQRAKSEGRHLAGTRLANYAADRITELEEEVRHLKAELAKRPVEVVEGRFRIVDPQFNTRPFTPVPKK